MKVFDNIFLAVDEVLTEKSLAPLTIREKNHLLYRLRQSAIEWKMMQKATNAEFALNTQLQRVLSNAIYETLVKTRGYKNENH